MKPTLKHRIIIAAVTGALTLPVAQAQTQTPDRVETRIGTLSFERGYPTPETTKKIFDDLDYQRAVQAYLWAYPAVSFESIRMAAQKELGTDLNDIGIADNFVDARSMWLTANDTTIYAFANVDLGKAGPVVIEIPPGAIVGLVDDFWQRSASDLGLPGPHGDKGGKFLLLPPGYKGEVPKEGFAVLRGTMNNYNVMVRGIVTNLDSDVPKAVERVRKLRVYPYAERASPKPNRFTSMSGKVMSTLPPSGLEFWARLSAFINNNPIQERDQFFMAMLKPLGIEKGKPFNPDARQRGILEEAARMGDATGRTMLFDAEHRFAGFQAMRGTHWNWVLLVNPYQVTPTHGQLDERLHYTYGAIYTSPGIGVMKAGPGSNYIQTFKDKDGNRLDGAKSYRMRVPANVPAAAFWSVTLYDTAIRSMIQNSRNDSARSSYEKLKVNADGSIDMYFGPKAPPGEEGNWIETVPGKGFYPMIRFYSPKVGLFDGSWKLPDVEMTK